MFLIAFLPPELRWSLLSSSYNAGHGYNHDGGHRDDHDQQYYLRAPTSSDKYGDGDEDMCQAIRALKLKAGEDVEDTALLGRLMAYCSKVRKPLLLFPCAKPSPKSKVQI